MMRAATALPACLLLACLAGCSRPPASDLFPLDKGHRWTYQTTTTYENNVTERETQVFTSLGSERLEDGSAWRRHGDSGIDYWLRSDETGIYRVASKSDISAEPQPDKPVRYVLKMPLAVGTNWQATTTAYLLRRTQEFPPEIRHTHPAVPMSYSIDALGQTLNTPAGQFKDCVRVKGQSTLKLFADPVVGWKDLPLTTLEWYCPGVGLARVERHEPAHSTFLTGGDLIMELVAWE